VVGYMRKDLLVEDFPKVIIKKYLFNIEGFKSQQENICLIVE